jgi:hypothetical protein
MQRSACHDPHVPVQFVYRGPAAWRCAGPPFAQERAARIREIQIARRIVCVSGASARSASGRSSLQVSVSGPTAGCRRDGVARARRAVGSRVPIRVVRSWTQRTGRVPGMDGDAWGSWGCGNWWLHGPSSWDLAGAMGGGHGGGRRGTAALSPIPDSGYRKKKVHTQPHCASRRTTLFSPPVGMMSRVRRHPTAPRLVLKCL